MIYSIFILAFLSSLLLNWILIKFSLNLGVRNISIEEEVRWQGRKPSIGGLSFYICFLIIFSILSFIIKYKDTDYPNSELSLLISCTLGFIIGLIDDARNTNPILKLIGQIICALSIVFFGLVIEISPNLIWNQLMTLIWIVFLMNSINMLDNMDGMTTIVCIFILFSFLLLSNSPMMYNYLILSLISILLGFLYFNWYPSKIYMGDSGSQFLGVLLAHISIHSMWENRIESGGYFQLNQFFLPLLIFTIPIFDTTTVFIHRLLKRSSPFIGGKDHLSHHLVYLGFKDYQAVMTLGFINIVFILIAISYYKTTSQNILYGFIGWITVFLLLQIAYMAAMKRKQDSTSN